MPSYFLPAARTTVVLRRGSSPASSAAVASPRAASARTAICSVSASLFQHPQVGPLELRYEKLLVPGVHRQTLVTYHALPGSASEECLRLLAGMTPGPGAPGAEVPGPSFTQ
ncbi:hypothetical protein ABZX30_31070 [Streptomyces sp. NPDC004542]|uniref:MmyB family transcriptional regulator n=1 Tax=Streptomyces sp. NPDC004542 TaxID=3154281 RepID=UPI0033B2ADA8